MNTADIEARVSRLERQNRRMKIGMIVTVVTAITLSVVAQVTAQPRDIKARKIEAQEFSLVRNGEEVGKWSIGEEKKMNPFLEMKGDSSFARIHSLGLFVKQEFKNTGTEWTGFFGANSLTLRARTKVSQTYVNLQDDVLLMNAPEGGIRITVGKDETAVSVFDERLNLRATLGSVDLETKKTGSKITRPPSSLVLFDKEGTVIFEAPRD